MTDTTKLDDVVVVGQRKGPGGSFPPAGGGGGGTGSGIHQNEVSPDDPNPPTPPHPCDHPDTALPWNADAAGAQSVSPFLSKAAELGDVNPQTGQPTLGGREFGRGLARDANGAVRANAVSWGPPTSGPVSGMTVDFTGITNADYLGDAHSHPNGNLLPSIEDWSGFMNNNQAARNFGRTNETFYMYIFAVNPDGISGTSHVYQDGPRAADSADPPRPTTVGPEVNPDAQPCP